MAIKRTIQIVDVSGSKPKHVKKITVACASAAVLQRIVELFAGQLVFAKTAPSSGADRRQKKPIRDVKG